MSNIDQVGNCWFFLFLRLMDVCTMHRKKKTPFFVPSYTPSSIHHISCELVSFFFSCFFITMDDCICLRYVGFIWCFRGVCFASVFMWHVMTGRRWDVFHAPLNIVTALVSLFALLSSIVRAAGFFLTTNWTYIYIYIYIHTCILAYLHTCIHAYMHTYYTY